MLPSLESDNAYEILGVARDAGVPEIRKAFKKLAIKHHPDARPADEKEAAAQLFAKINQAHEVLRDPTKRKQYDSSLDRGVTPDLQADLAHAAAFDSLTSIIGEISSLGIKEKELPWGMDKTLRDQFLMPSLLDSGELKESHIDCIDISSVIETENWDRPQGSLTDGYMVITELRIFVLLTFVHEWQSGNTKYTETYWRQRAFTYLSLDGLNLKAVGRTNPKRLVVLRDEDGTMLTLQIGSKNQPLSRLFLVANRYKLPITTDATANKSDEYGEAFGWTMVLPGLWCIPYAFTSVISLLAICGKNKWDPFGAWGDIFRFFNEIYVNTVLLYFTPFLLVMLMTKVYKAWGAVNSEEIFGWLRLDFAEGAHDIPGVTPRQEETERPSTAPPTRERRPERKPESLLPSPAVAATPAKAPPPATVSMPHSLSVTGEAGESPQSAKTNAVPPAPAVVPVAVAMPGSILEAMGGGAPAAQTVAPPLAAGEQADEPVAAKHFRCPRCGTDYQAEEGATGWLTCPECGQEFEPV